MRPASPNPPSLPAEDPLAQLAAGPIFIVGVARSGTSWVAQILGIHHHVGAMFESHLFDSQTGLVELFGRRFSGQGGLSRFLTREELAEEVRLFTSRIFARALRPQHQFLVEKTPGHLHMMPLIAEIFPHARFIHVVRDGRDVFVSTRAGTRSWASGWTWRRRAFPLLGVARRWKRAIRKAAQEGSALGGRYMEIRFEDLKDDPLASYARLYEFCGIPADDEMLQRIQERTDFNRRHTPDESAFFRGGRVGDWKTHMNMFEGLVFNALAGDVLIEKGYEESRGWRAPLRRKVRPPRRRSNRRGTATENAP